MPANGERILKNQAYELNESDNFMGHHWLRQCDREKSGPAFNKVEKSRLVAVMRRDAKKARADSGKEMNALVDKLVGCVS
jgi:hypothetical protein